MKAALATPEPITVPAERSFGHLALLVITFGELWFVLCRHLSGEWSVNEQYAYGWFVPFFCAYLFWLRWEDAPQPESAAEAPNSKSQTPNGATIAIAITALLLLLPLRVFEIGNPDWRPLGWIHAAIVVTVILLALWWAGGQAWLRHFAFPVAFIFVAVPWVSPVEQPVVQGLMRVVAAAATEGLTLCGIPAQVEGNLIRISSGVVGVNEACSGVRALQTALMIGLLFGELKRFSPGRRAGLILVAVALSIFANFLRTFFLVLVAADKGIGAVDRWHDIAGYSIVAVVFLGTLATTALLGKNSPTSHRSEVTSHKLNVRPFMVYPVPVVVAVLCWLVLVEIASLGWYEAHERDLVARTRWSVRWPVGEESFRELKINESVRQTLRFDEGRSARWYAPASAIAGNGAAPESPAISHMYCTVFFFRWNPGGGTLLRARAHRPEICLPSAGWEQTADDGARLYQVEPGLTLPFRHLEFVHKQRARVESDQFAHTFFCLQQDWTEPKSSAGARTAVVTSESRDWGVLARVHAVEQGLRDLGQQTMELVFVTSHSLASDTAEEQFVAQLRTLIKVERVDDANER
ncbi:MAG TPA: exosortase/archaeosortase family protein [Chthoniobacterales bacterium]